MKKGTGKRRAKSRGAKSRRRQKARAKEKAKKKKGKKKGGKTAAHKLSSKELRKAGVLPHLNDVYVNAITLRSRELERPYLMEPPEMS